jgi:hypothetical protein
MTIRLDRAWRAAAPGSVSALFWRHQLEKLWSRPEFVSKYRCPHDRFSVRPIGNDQPEIGDRFRCDVCEETVWCPSEKLLKASVL